MTPCSRPASSPSPLRILTAVLPWVLGAVAVALLALFVDEPVARWCLANRDVPPLPQFQMTLGYTGAGGVQAPVLLAALLGGAVVTAQARRLLGLAAFTLCLASFLFWSIFSPEGKDAFIALVGLPAFFLIAWVCSSIANSGRGNRARFLAVCRWLLVAFVVSTLLTSGLKSAVRRPRPMAMDLPRPALADQLSESNWRSFPSGDVLVTAALVMVLWGLAGRPQSLSWLFAFPAVAMVQRIVAAKHFPSDVLGGLLLGVLVGMAIIAWAEARGWPPAPRESRSTSEGGP